MPTSLSPIAVTLVHFPVPLRILIEICLINLGSIDLGLGIFFLPGRGKVTRATFPPYLLLFQLCVILNMLRSKQSCFITTEPSRSTAHRCSHPDPPPRTPQKLINGFSPPKRTMSSPQTTKAPSRPGFFTRLRSRKSSPRPLVGKEVADPVSRSSSTMNEDDEIAKATYVLKRDYLGSCR